jgi:hypothetical protein
LPFLARDSCLTRTDRNQPLSPTVKWLLVLWCVLLVPWTFIATFAGFVFATARSNIQIVVSVLLVGSVWTYPLGIMLAFYFRRRYPRLVWLPTLNVAPLLVVLVAYKFGLL